MEPLTFYVWEPILSAFGFAYNDALLSRPSVFPIIHVLHNYPDHADYNPPGTGTTYDTPDISAQGVALAIKNWNTHHTANVVGKAFGDRPKYLCIHNTGYWNSVDPTLSSGDNDTYGIFRYPYDVLTSIGGVAPWQEFLGPYCDEGRSYNANLQELIAVELDAISDVTIGYIDHDIETLPDWGYALPYGGNAWLEPYLADSRLSSEVAWDGNTHDDVWDPVTAVDADASPNTAFGFYASQNNNFRSWVAQFFGPNLHAWAWKTAILDPWKAVFPSVKVGNYDIYSMNVVPAHPFLFAKTIQVDRTFTNSFLDFDSVELYEVAKSMFRLDSQANFEADVTTILGTLGLTTTGDVELDIIKISVAQAKAKIAMCHAAGKDTIFWIRYRELGTDIHTAFGYEWMYAQADWWHILKFALDRGFRKFVIFTGTDPITAPALADLASLVAQAEAYVGGGTPSRLTGRLSSGKIASAKVTRK